MPSPIVFSLRHSAKIVARRKQIVAALFALQLLFFFTSFKAITLFMPQIVENTINILEYSQNLQIDEQEAAFDILQQKLPLGDDPLLISRNFKEIRKTMVVMLLSLMGIYILINGAMWFLIDSIFKKKKEKFTPKRIMEYISKFFVVLLILFILLIIVLYSSLHAAFSSFLQRDPISLLPFFVLSVIALYFTYIAIPLIGKTPLRKIPNLSFSIGIKNIGKIILMYLIIMIMLGGVSYFIFVLVENNLFILTILIILLIAVFVWSKLFLFATVEKLRSL